MKKTRHFFEKYKPFVIILSLALVLTIMIGSIRGYANRDALGDSFVLSDESLGNSLGNSGVQTLGTSTRSNIITIAADDKLYLTDQKYHTDSNPAEQNLPTNAIIQVVDGDSGYGSLSVEISGINTIQQIAAEDLNVEIRYVTPNTTLIIKNENGTNCVKAEGFNIYGQDKNNDKLIIKGNPNGPSVELDIVHGEIGNLNASIGPNNVNVYRTDDEGYGEGYFSINQSILNITVGNHPQNSDVGFRTEEFTSDGSDVTIVGTNKVNKVFRSGIVHLYTYGYNTPHTIRVTGGSQVAIFIDGELFVAEHITLEGIATAPGSTGVLCDDSKRQYESGINVYGKLIAKGEAHGLVSNVMDGIFIESGTVIAEGNLSGMTIIRPYGFEVKDSGQIIATLKGNLPNAKAALYIDNKPVPYGYENDFDDDEDYEAYPINISDASVHLISEENNKKGAAFTYELREGLESTPSQPIIILDSSAKIELIMPTYQTNVTDAFNFIMHDGPRDEYRILIDDSSMINTHYTKPVKINLAPSKPYNANENLTAYEWSPDPSTIELIVSAEGFESRSIANNKTLLGKPKGTISFNNKIKVHIDATGPDAFTVTYDDVTYTKNTTLTLKGEGGIFDSNHTDTVTKTITKDVAVGTLEVPVRTGYEFKGFFTKQNGQGTEYTSATIFTGTRPLTLYAHWSLSNFAVNFVANDGTPAPASQSIAYQGFVKEPAKMTKTGYTFKGWYKEASFNTEWKFATDKMPAKNITLYAKWEINKYKVTFHPNGGTPGPAQQNLDYQSLVTEPGAMTKTGHTFKGWYQDTGFTQPWNFGTSRVPAKNLNLYAKWEVNKYQMNFVANGGTPAPAPVNVTYNTLAKEPAKMSKAGYTFGGWYKDAGLTQPWNFAKDKMPANNVTLYAQWKEITYTANFDPNGGTPKPASVKVKFGKKIPTPVTVTKIGYNFTNWYKGSSVWNFATDTMPNSDITLKAGWVVDPNVKFKVNFDPNGGTLDYLQKEYPAETVIPVPNGVRPGYILDHWKYGGKTWKVGVDKTPNKDITLIAQWKIDPNQKIQVTFDAKGGAPTPPAQTHMVEELISKPSNPTRYGYNFTGWIYKDTGKLWNFEKTKIADKNFPGPMVMEATWKPDPNVKFTVTFDPGPLGTVTPTSEKHVVEEKINEPKASRHGYTLQGWKKDDGTHWNFKTDRMPAKDITLKADWKFDPTAKVTVEFDANRGKPTPPNQLVQYGHKVVEPTNVIRPGYNLTGWKLLRDGKIWDFENDTIEQKHFDDRFVLQAQWKVDPAQMITVHFDTQGGKPVPNFQLIIPLEQLVTSPTIPVKHGYDFLGWFTEPEGGRYWNFEKDLAEPSPKEFVLYAHWQKETGPGKSNPDPGYHGETPMPDVGTGQGENSKIDIDNQYESAPVLEDTGEGNETVTPQNPNPSTGGTKARISGYLHKMTTGDDLTIDGVVVEPLRARDAVVMIAVPVILLVVIVGTIYMIVKKRKNNK